MSRALWWSLGGGAFLMPLCLDERERPLPDLATLRTECKTSPPRDDVGVCALIWLIPLIGLQATLPALQGYLAHKKRF